MTIILYALLATFIISTGLAAATNSPSLVIKIMLGLGGLALLSLFPVYGVRALFYIIVAPIFIMPLMLGVSVGGYLNFTFLRKDKNTGEQ